MNVKLDARTPEQIKQDEKDSICCRKFWGWFFQLLVWASFALFISMYIASGTRIDNGYWIQFICVYVCYFIYCCCTHTFAYLRNFKRGNDIYTYMGSLFYKPAYVDFHIACYHMETRLVKRGKSWRTERVKVVTYRGTETFKYMSWRDISGLFELKTSAFAKNPNKTLVKLKLTLGMEFPDDGTAYDFECQKQFFINANKHRDTSYDFYQNTRMDNLEEFNMISIDGKARFTISAGFYIICSLLMLIEFYKIYVDKYCTYQTFEVKKLVSTKSNLNQPENFKPYFKWLPSVKIKDVVVFNDQSKLGEITVVPDLPEFDEVTKGELMKKASSLNGPGPDIHYDPNYHPPEHGNDIVIQDGQNNAQNSYGYSPGTGGMEYNSVNNEQLTAKLTVVTYDDNKDQGNNNSSYGYQSPALNKEVSGNTNNSQGLAIIPVGNTEQEASYGYNPPETKNVNEIERKRDNSTELTVQSNQDKD